MRKSLSLYSEDTHNYDTVLNSVLWFNWLLGGLWAAMLHSLCGIGVARMWDHEPTSRKYFRYSNSFTTWSIKAETFSLIIFVYLFFHHCHWCVIEISLNDSTVSQWVMRHEFYTWNYLMNSVSCVGSCVNFTVDPIHW